MPKNKFPEYLFVAREGTKKHVYYGAEENISNLVGFIDEHGTLEIATYELVLVKKMRLEEEETRPAPLSGDEFEYAS